MPAESDPFPIRLPVDEDGGIVTDEKDKDRFCQGRSGDHFVCPFQCETCHFRNIKGRDIDLSDDNDNLAVIVMRRAILDSFWARERGTVQSTASGVRTILRKGKILGFTEEELFPARGPFDLTDDWGMGIACCMLLRTLDPGENEALIQFGTARKIRSAYSNYWQSSVHGPQATVAMRDTTKLFITSCPTNGLWYERFQHGVHKRQGDLIKPDMAISIEAMLALMDVFEMEWKSCESERERAEIIFPALFAMITYCGGLRGEETPLTDLAGMRKYFLEGVTHKTHPHVPIALLGRFKNDGIDKYHYLPIALETRSGLKIKPWVDRMFAHYEKRGIKNGRVFRDLNSGKPAKQGDYEYEILKRLVEIQARGDGTIPLTDDIFEDMGVRRTFRRGANSQARNQGVSPEDIKFLMRWSALERGKGMAVGGDMLMHYTELRLSLPTMIRFSSAL